MVGVGWLLCLAVPVRVRSGRADGGFTSRPMPESWLELELLRHDSSEEVTAALLPPPLLADPLGSGRDLVAFCLVRLDVWVFG